MLFTVTMAVAMRYGYGPALAMTALFAGGELLDKLATGQSVDAALAFRGGFLAITALLASYLRHLANAAETALQERLVEVQTLYRDLALAHQELLSVDQMKTSFLANVSHELRTPLTSILGYLDLFERGTLGALSEIQGHAIDVISRNAHTLTRQLNNLLYLQEVRSSQIKPIPVTVYDMVLRLVAELQPQADSSGLQLEMALQPTLIFAGDAMALEQAFRNLIDNAIKFTPRGGRIRVTLADDPTRIILQVEDSGIGIPEEAQEKIFVPFYQVDSSLARPFPGAGLGLAIVRHVVEAHGGQVTVRSAPGSGSTFTIVLPRR
jgi:signal transduction histidine kinase